MDFSTTILLTPKESNRYQAIYASQQYGTFYGLYGKFDIEKKGKKTFLKRIDFKLLNYKGILNMSLEGNPDSIIVDEKAKETIREIPVVLVKVQLRAKVQEPKYDDFIEFIDPIRIKKNMYFSVLGEVLPLNENDTTDETDPAFCGGVFDDEFYFRDGMVHKKRKITKIPLDHGDSKSGDRGFKFESEIINIGNSRFGSIRCRVGNSKIIV